MRISEKNKNRMTRFNAVFLVSLFGFFVILGLGVFGLLLSPIHLALGGVLALWLLIIGKAVSGKAFRILLVYVAICFFLVAPIHVLYNVIVNRNIALSLTASKEITYFREVLGRSYNYTELLQWISQAITWNSSPDMKVYSDPIEIYEYHQARCAGYAILYAELCISQGYECRIVISMFRDHAWNEVKIDGNWTRVDASPTGAPMNENVGYPLFYEEKWNAPPIFALAFDGSSVTEVTSHYRSDHWSLWSIPTAIFGLIGTWFAVCILVIWRRSSGFPSMFREHNQRAAKSKYINS